MGRFIEVKVHNNDIDKALRIFKKKIQNDGVFKTLREKRSHEKPSQKKRRKHREALKRLRRLKRQKR